ncbi:phosphoglycolate phosphatase [Bordetella sp. N]|uniref:phosphoglycolate phosphatase n=1 Tax=Bordetella sp. N TaxID=1746199 RepID=UPI000708C9EE|nr:phosphoglycolate phosphatase [Bordetella sp. N]ALM82603.1 phosphoglycolate phosphatase [Bordetella sp. N]
MTDHNIFRGATIAFDLDGTLVESAPDLIAAVNAALATEDFRPITYDDGRPLISRGARALLQFGLEAAGELNPAAKAAALFGYFIEYYGSHIADETRPFPGVIDALEVLKTAGAKLVVCTNKPTELSRSLLDKLDMMRFFDGVMGMDAVTAAKPDPAHLIEAVQAVEGDLMRTVMVGDADTDAGTARAAGIPLILVDFGYSETPVAELSPDILLHHFDDLVAACGRLLRSHE